MRPARLPACLPGCILVDLLMGIQNNCGLQAARGFAPTEPAQPRRCPCLAVSKWWYLAISVIVAILFSCYLVYHIQLVMGGKKVAISPDEYVFASVQASGGGGWRAGWAEDDGQRQPAAAPG